MFHKKIIISATLAGLLSSGVCLADENSNKQTTQLKMSGAVLTGSVILTEDLEASPDRYVWELDKVQDYVNSSIDPLSMAHDINGVIGEKAVRQKVYFKTNEHNLTKKAKDYLTQMVKGIHNYPNIKITLEGHADIRGDDVYNKQLAKKRINGIRSTLVEAGVNPEYIKIVNIANDNKKEKEETSTYFFDRVVNIYFYR